MIFNTISINPEFIKTYFQFGINAKAMRKEIFKINYWNPLKYCGKKDWMIHLMVEEGVNFVISTYEENYGGNRKKK